MMNQRQILKNAVIVILLAGGAAGLRQLLGAQVGSRASFLLYVLAVTLAAEIAGTASALIVTAFGAYRILHYAPASDVYMPEVLAIFAVVGVALSIFGGWRKRAKDKSRRIQYNLETAQQIANIGSWESELKGKLWWSAQTYNIFGVDAGTELTTADFYNLVHPEDRDRVRETVKHALETHSDYDVEHRIVRGSDGAIRHVHQRAKILANGKVRLIGSIQDVTEEHKMVEALKNAHDRLTLKHEVARMGTFEWFVKEGYVEWSPEMEKIYGLEGSIHIRAIEEWKAFLHPEDVAETMAALEEAPRQHLPAADQSYRIVRPDGQVRWIHSRRQYEYDADGNPVHVIGINIDVTELKQGEIAQQILGGLLQVCSACRRIRDESTEEWYSMEGYLRRHSATRFSHGMCEDCGRQWFPEAVDEDGHDGRRLA